MGSVSKGAIGTVLSGTGNTTPAEFLPLSTSGAIISVTGNDSFVVTPTAGNINVLGTGSITTSGIGSTENISLTGLTNHAVLIGAGTDTITNVGPILASGAVLQSQGALADPAYSTAIYPSTTTINEILYSSTSDVITGLATLVDGVLLTDNSGVPFWLANSGAPGFVLTSNAGAPPSWQVGGSSTPTTINGDSSFAVGPTINLFGTPTGLSFTGDGVSTITLGGVLLGANGGTGIANTGLTIDLGLATLGYVLTSDSSGNATWQPGDGGGSGIVTIDGTISFATGTTVGLSAGTTGLTYTGDGISTITTGGTLVVGNGGTGATTLTGVVLGNGTSAMTAVTGVNDGVLITSNTGVVSWLPNGTTGQILTATTGAIVSWSTNPGSTAIQIIDGDFGSATGTTLTLTGGSTGLTFSGSGAILTMSGVLNVTKGGTGDNVFTAYAPIVAGTTGTGAFQQATTGFSTSGFILTSTGSSSLPTWQAPAASSIMISGDSGGALSSSSFTFTGGTTGLTFAGAGTTETLGGVLVVSNGGTGAPTLTGLVTGNGTSAMTASSITNHAVLVGGASNAVISIGPTATIGQILQSAGATANPAFSTATYPLTSTINQLLFSSAANTITGLTAANDGVLISSNTGVPSWLANSGTAGFILTANTGAPPSWQAAPASAVTSVTNFDGTLTISPTTGAVIASISSTYPGQTSIVTLGTVTAGTWNATNIALAHGGTSASLTASNGGIFYSTASAGAILAGTATARQMLQSGASTTPAWSTTTWPATSTINQILFSSAANVITGITSANDGVLVTSNTGVPSFLANSGTAGWVLTAQTGAPPIWAVAPGASSITTINGDSGSITGTTITIKAGNSTRNSGSTVEFVNSGTISTLNVSDVNGNTMVGNLSGNLTMTSTNCTGFGQLTLLSLTSGSQNTGCGFNNFGSLTTGFTNTGCGYEVGNQLLTGSYNSLFGINSGSNYTTSESSNIMICNVGKVGESNVIRIGANGTGNAQQNLCFIAGITGATPVTGNTPQVVLCDNLGNLTPIASSTTGFVLTSNGTATPSFQAPSGGSGITTVGDVTSGSVAFNGTAGTTLTTISAGGLFIVAANGSGSGGPNGVSGGQGSTNGGLLQLTGGLGSAGNGGYVTIRGGSSTGTNLSGSNINILTGLGTGTGSPAQIICSGTNQGTASSATAQVNVPRLVINGGTPLTSGSATTIVTPTISSNTMHGGHIFYTIEVTDGTNYQSVSGIAAYSITNKAGTTTGTATVIGSLVKNLTSGTYTDAWTVTSAGLVQYTGTTSLTATTFRMTCQVMSGSQQAITVV